MATERVPQAVAAEAFSLLGSGRQVETFSSRYPGLDLETAYDASARLLALREEAGERPVGRKIGFTNRTIWNEYGVHAPIWNYMFDRTVADLHGRPVPLAGLSEPRLEPEIIFGFAAAPSLDMSDAELLGCIGWVAHGFEIVQSLFAGWQFAAADTVAAYGLHGLLRIGPRMTLDDALRDQFAGLSSLRIEIYRDGERMDEGVGSNVLEGGPIAAIRYLIGILETDPHHAALAAGEIVTTGTLTRAFPVQPGETWTTRLHGIPLDGVEISFV